MWDILSRHMVRGVDENTKALSVACVLPEIYSKVCVRVFTNLIQTCNKCSYEQIYGKQTLKLTVSIFVWSMAENALARKCG
jgi:hypothetical protein